jgi:hypothetical protein
MKSFFANDFIILKNDSKNILCKHGFGVIMGLKKFFFRKNK